MEQLCFFKIGNVGYWLGMVFVDQGSLVCNDSVVVIVIYYQGFGEDSFFLAKVSKYIKSLFNFLGYFIFVYILVDKLY